MSIPSPCWQGLVCFLALSFEVRCVERSVAVADCLSEALPPPTNIRVHLLRSRPGRRHGARLAATFPSVGGPC